MITNVIYREDHTIVETSKTIFICLFKFKRRHRFIHIYFCVYTYMYKLCTYYTFAVLLIKIMLNHFPKNHTLIFCLEKDHLFNLYNSVSCLFNPQESFLERVSCKYLFSCVNSISVKRKTFPVVFVFLQMLTKDHKKAFRNPYN